MLPVYVAIPQVQLLDKVVVPVVCTTNALVQLLITVEVPQLQFLYKVVNIPVVRRDSFPWSHYSETIEILLLQYNDKVDDADCARRAGSHGCRRGGDSRAPTVALVEKFNERGSSSTRL